MQCAGTIHRCLAGVRQPAVQEPSAAWITRGTGDHAELSQRSGDCGRVIVKLAVRYRKNDPAPWWTIR
jgi:hypothetical protein